MSMNDILSDVLTRLRNGQQARIAVVRCLASNLVADVLKVLESEGYIRAYRKVETEAGLPEMEVELKYHEGAPVIHEIKRVSTPGRRVYSKISNLPRVKNGLGISILSTSKGVMSDNEARQANLGGEVLCTVF
jgi:small subunit ribosomal protein S8